MKAEYKEHILTKILLPVAGAALVIGAIFLYLTFYTHESAILNDAKKRTDCVKDIFKKSLEYETNKSIGLFTFFDSNDKVESAFETHDKKALYDIMKPIYDNLHAHFNITHIYFFEPDGKILLRVHEYEKSGDYPKRITLQNAIKTGKISSGLEFGIHRNLTHRTVKPFIINGKIAGYIEIGKEIEEIMADVSNISKADTVVAINRSILKPDDFEKWKHHQKNPRFYADTKKYFLVSSTFDDLNKEVLSNIDKEVKNGEEVEINGDVNVINSIPLMNAGNAEIGTIIVYSNVQAAEDKLKKTFALSTVVAILMWAVIAFIFYSYYSKIQHRVNGVLTNLYKTGIVDGLTGVYNRRYLDETISDDIKTALEEQKKIFFIMLDIDFFKKYNDIYGHQKGDEAIKAVARAIIDVFDKENEKVYRLGGEEFGVLGMSDHAEEYIKKSEALRAKIQKLKIEHKGNEAVGYVTISIGLYVKDDYIDEPFENIYKKADTLLYTAKESGRNRIESNLV